MDVILFLDSFAEARARRGGTLDPPSAPTARSPARTSRAATASASSPSAAILRWLVPGMRDAQHYRIVDALLDTEIVLNYAWKDIDVIPPRALPPKALVVALTPLLDERSVGALLDLRARGFDLAMVDISPVPFSTPGEGELDASRTGSGCSGATRPRPLRAAGVAVAAGTTRNRSRSH